MLRLSPGNSIYSGELSFKDQVTRRGVPVKAAFDLFYKELLFTFRGNVFIYNLPKAEFSYSRSGTAFKSLNELKVNWEVFNGERILDVTFSFQLYRGEKSRIYGVNGVLKNHRVLTEVRDPLRLEVILSV